MSYEYKGKSITIDVNLNLLKYSSQAYYSVLRNHLIFIKNQKQEYNNKNIVKYVLLTAFALYSFFSLAQNFSNTDPIQFLWFIPLLVPIVFNKKIKRFNEKHQSILNDLENTKLYLNYHADLEWENILNYTKNMNGVTRIASLNQIFFSQSVIKLNAKNYLLPRSLLKLNNDFVSIVTSQTLLSKISISSIVFQKSSTSSFIYRFSNFEGSQWLHQRKDGGPDNRYRENYIIEFRKAYMLYIDNVKINVEYDYIYNELKKNYTMLVSKEEKPLKIKIDGNAHLLNQNSVDAEPIQIAHNEKSTHNIINEAYKEKVINSLERNDHKEIKKIPKVENTTKSKQIKKINKPDAIKSMESKINQNEVPMKIQVDFDYSKKFESEDSKRYSAEYKNYIISLIVSGTPLKTLAKQETLDEKTTRGWLYTLLETLNFDPYRREEWLNNEELLNMIQQKGVSIFTKQKNSKKRDPLSLKVESLKISEDALIQLKLSGIDQLEDFNTFSLKELKLLLASSYEEITYVLKKYVLPRPLENMNIPQEAIHLLRTNNIEDLLALFETNSETISHIFEDYSDLYLAVNEALSFYKFLPKIQANNVKLTTPKKETKKRNVNKVELTLKTESIILDSYSESNIDISISTSNINQIIDFIWEKNYSISKIMTGDKPSISLVPNSKKSIINRHISNLENPYIVLYVYDKQEYDDKSFNSKKMLTYKINEAIDYGQTVKLRDYNLSSIGIVIGKSNVLHVPYYYEEAVEVFGKLNDYIKEYDIKYIFNDAIQKMLDSKTIYSNMELLYLAVVVNELSYDLYTNQTHYYYSMILTTLKILYNKLKNHQFQKDYFFTGANLSKGISIIKDYMKQGHIDEFINNYQTEWIDYLSESKIKNPSKELKSTLKVYAFTNGHLKYNTQSNEIDQTIETNSSIFDNETDSITYSVKTNLDKLDAFCIEHIEQKTTSVKHNPDFGSLVKNKKVYNSNVTTFIFKTVLSQYKDLMTLNKEVYDRNAIIRTPEAKEKRIQYLQLLKEFEMLLVNFLSYFNKDDANQFIRSLLKYSLKNNINKTNKFYVLQPLLMISNINVLDIMGNDSLSYSINGKGYPDYFRKVMNEITGVNNTWIGITNIALRDEKGAKEVAKKIISNPLYLSAPKNSFETYLSTLNFDSYNHQYILNYRGSMLYRPNIPVDYNKNEFRILESSVLKNQPLDKLIFSRIIKLNGLVLTEKIGSQIKTFISLYGKLYDINGNEVTLNNIDIFVATTTYMGENYYMWEMIATAHTGYFINNLLFGENFSKAYPKLKQKTSIYKETEFIDKSQLEELKTIKKDVVVENKKGIAATLDLGERQLTPVIIEDKLAFIDQNQKIFKSFPKQLKTDNDSMYSIALDEVERIKSLVAGTKKETQDYLKVSFRKHEEIPFVKYTQLFSERLTSAFADNWLYVAVKEDTNIVFYHDDDLIPRNINDEVVDIAGSRIFTAHPYYYHNALDNWIKLFADYDRSIEKLQLSTKFYNVLELMDDKGIIQQFNGLTLSSNKVYFGLIQTEIFEFADDGYWGDNMHSLENEDMYVEIETSGHDIMEITINEFDHSDIETIIRLSNQLHLVISATE